MFDILGYILFDLIIASLEHIGAGIKWLFLRKKLQLQTDFEATLGGLFLISCIAFAIYLFDG